MNNNSAKRFVKFIFVILVTCISRFLVLRAGSGF